MGLRRNPNRPKTDIQVAQDFYKAKGLPVPGRIAGGGSRRVYYEQPERVHVITGKRHLYPYQMEELEPGLVEQALSIPAQLGAKAVELAQRLLKA